MDSQKVYPINPELCAISVIEKRQQSVHMRGTSTEVLVWKERREKIL